MTVEYIIEKLKKDGQSYSVGQFIYKWKGHTFNPFSISEGITSSLNLAKKYKTIGGARRKIIEIREESRFLYFNFGLVKMEYGKIIDRSSFLPIPIKMKKPKRIISRWEIMEI